MRYVSRIVTKLQSITTHCSLHRSFTRVIPDLIRDLSLVVSQNKIPAFAKRHGNLKKVVDKRT